MTTTIEVNGLQLQGHHGVSDQELTVGNTFLFDIALSIDIDLRQLRADDLSSTISYADVVSIVRDENSRPSRLLENVGYRIYIALISRWPSIVSGHLRIAKITPPIGCQLSSAAVSLKW